jgi:hypothetical protein
MQVERMRLLLTMEKVCQVAKKKHLKEILRKATNLLQQKEKAENNNRHQKAVKKALLPKVKELTRIPTRTLRRKENLQDPMVLT